MTILIQAVLITPSNGITNAKKHFFGISVYSHSVAALNLTTFVGFGL